MNPIAMVIAASRTGGVSTVTVNFDKWPGAPAAPAWLRAVSSPSHKPYLSVHRLTDRNGNTATFEAYRSESALPLVGERYIWTCWFLTHGMDAILDRSATWEYRQYPDDGTDFHCLIYWDEIAYPAYGYYSPERDDWLTVKAYEEFIRDDIYHIRATKTRTEDC